MDGEAIITVNGSSISSNLAHKAAAAMDCTITKCRMEE